MNVIIIDSRNADCSDCKLTIRKKEVVWPSLLKKIFLRATASIKITTEVWYGSRDSWYGAPPHNEKMDSNRAMFFHKMWEYHVREKRRRGIAGKYSTVINNSGLPKMILPEGVIRLY